MSVHKYQISHTKFSISMVYYIQNFCGTERMYFKNEYVSSHFWNGDKKW